VRRHSETIDNDLPITDCSPGFGSVAKFITTSLREAAFDLAAMSRAGTHPHVVELVKIPEDALQELDYGIDR
jgi:ATP-dependent phosphofructokinase / diphosphate-dependent phosphofructokinase